MDARDAFTTQEVDALTHIALGIVAARTVSQMADALLEGLPHLVTCEKSFFTREPNVRGSRRRVTRSLTMTDEELAQYENLYMGLDYTAWYLEQDGVSVYRDSDVVSPEVIASSRIYNEWVRPMGMEYVCGSVMHEGGVRVADITLFRSAEHGDFTNNELFLLEAVTRLVEAWLARERPVATSTKTSPEMDQPRLTPRELEVARLACTGMSVREMSDYLAVSYGTARRHLANIYEKLGINSRVQLIEHMR